MRTDDDGDDKQSGLQDCKLKKRKEIWKEHTNLNVDDLQRWDWFSPVTGWTW